MDDDTSQDRAPRAITIRKLLACMVALLGPIGTLIGFLALHYAVPDPLPVHWNWRGDVDNTASVGSFFVTTLVIAAVLAVAAILAIWLAHSPMAGRMLASVLGFGSWMAGVTFLATLIAASGAADAHAVTLPWYAVAAAVIAAVLGAGAVWILLPARWRPWSGPQTAPTMVLAPGERVVWIDHVHSAVMRGLSAVLALAGAALLFTLPQAAVPAFVVAVAAAMVSELAVRIDPAGLHTLWGPFGWPRPRIPLADIAAVRSEQIVPMQWGGWGYRISSRGVAAVIRRGPGLVIERRRGPAYAVTVPHADRGAEVLAALLARQAAAGTGSEAGGHQTGT